MATMSARFWIRYNGDFVKLTLKPGEEASFGYVEEHEEGYSGQHFTYSFDAFEVTRLTYYWGKDCDGCHSNTYEDYAPLAQLKDNQYIGTDGTPLSIYHPNWHSKEERIYDQYAEAAGY